MQDFGTMLFCDRVPQLISNSIRSSLESMETLAYNHLGCHAFSFGQYNIIPTHLPQERKDP